MSNWIDKIATLRTATPEDVRVAIQFAKEDDHSVPFTTHVVKKHNEIVGAVSLGSVPMVLWWQHTKLVLPRESIMLIAQSESMLRCAGIKTWCVPVKTNSPYHGLMEKLGYVSGGMTELFFNKE